jgi:hypothetical protein
MTTLRCDSCEHGPCFISNKSETKLMNIIDDICCILHMEERDEHWRKVA